jgi:Rad3-related DNA helicase
LTARDALRAIFADNGPLSELIPDYQTRPGQVEMALRVYDALAHSRVLIAEAGTGIGKSLAYLIPAGLWSADHDEAIVISTHTRALQTQLLQKDVPVALAAIDDVTRERELAAVALKGRSNYLCRERWLTESTRRSPDPDLALLIDRIRPWAATTKTGDKSELGLDEGEERLFARISATNEICSNQQCRGRHGPHCWFARARTDAQRADLLIVNHALLFSDHGAGGTILPESCRLIIDEAHHLEAAATQHFSTRLSLNTLAAHIDNLVGLRGTTIEGLMPIAVSAVAAAGVFSDAEGDRTKALESLRMSLHDAETANRTASAVFELVDRIREEHGRDGSGHLRILSGIRRHRPWEALEEAGHDLDTALAKLETRAQWIERLLDRTVRRADLAAELEPTLAATVAWLERSREIRHQLGSAISRPDDATVYWFETSPGQALPAIAAGPLDAAALIQETLLAENETLVLTSATLSTGGTFRHFRNQVGVDSATELSLPSPFDYKRNALVYLASDMPEPSHRDYDDRVAEAIMGLSSALRGRTLVLFTSLRHLRSVASLVREPLVRKGISVFAQWQDGSPEALSQRLRQNEHTVVLGAASMWEGVDIQGAALSGLVVARLPFDVPTDPLFAARSELYDEPFTEFSVPRAAMRFRQGFGRLIRSEKDRGVFAILDRRIMTK